MSQPLESFATISQIARFMKIPLAHALVALRSTGLQPDAELSYSGCPLYGTTKTTLIRVAVEDAKLPSSYINNLLHMGNIVQRTELSYTTIWRLFAELNIEAEVKIGKRKYFTRENVRKALDSKIDAMTIERFAETSGVDLEAAKAVMTAEGLPYSLGDNVIDTVAMRAILLALGKADDPEHARLFAFTQSNLFGTY